MKITFTEKVQIALILLFPAMVYWTGNDLVSTTSLNIETVYMATLFSFIVGFAAYAITSIFVITRDKRQKTNWKQKVFLAVYGMFFLSILPLSLWQLWHFGIDKELASAQFFFIAIGTAPWIQVLFTDLRYQYADPIRKFAKESLRQSKLGLN